MFAVSVGKPHLLFRQGGCVLSSLFWVFTFSRQAAVSQPVASR
jgi:hypothetical protein